MTVVYIIGAGNSGSTVFCMTLGAHSRIVSIGELTRIDNYRVFDKSCTCGVQVSRCPFWSKVITADDDAKLTSIMPTNSIHSLWKDPAECVRRDPHFLETVDRNVNLYRRISEVSGKDVIVDSSKDPLRLLYLLGSGALQVVPVHLVRDGRSFIVSSRKRGHPWALPAIFRWARMNLQAEGVLRSMGPLGQFVRISYERFSREPEGVLRELCRRLNLQYESEMLGYHTREFHNIAGDRGRFKLQVIEPREVWRKKLSSMAKLAFILCGGHYLNRRFGVT